MDGLLILGNQLFPRQHLPKTDIKKTIVFMKEDWELCTHYKYHKHKIIFFLAAMRKYADELKAAGYEVIYQRLNQDQQDFTKSLRTFLDANQIKKVYFYEIEDKFFEVRIHQIFREMNGLEVKQMASPMFLTSRLEFEEYLSQTKKPFMKTFYERQRKRLQILVTPQGQPVGGHWSFDEKNRLSLPRDYVPPHVPKYEMTSTDHEVAQMVETYFGDHPGSIGNYWIPNDRLGAQKWLDSFLRERLALFGPYEDALSPEFPFINHSVLTPFLNAGLLTPRDVVTQTLDFAASHKIALNSIEGFIRQVIGWREFIRGIYQNFSDKQENLNFWNHQRKLKPCWYDGTTGIDPLDDVIRKVQRYGYAHHIERLMVVGSLMLLLEVHPHEAHRWFMEMFVDSSDWVMGPNVYGMALFSDGGIFATKPYFCGSNYYKKMGHYKKGPWQDGVDGLYWGFIQRNREFFLRNPRLSMVVRTFDKMNPSKKNKILAAAQELKSFTTYGVD
jgi:deoxyribodipyrimidine photolyase-related protein